jgi:protoporphyrinogen oxidase
MIAILGGGISGISTGYHLNLGETESVVFEKNPTWGGLCDNFTIGNGFLFDNFVHLSFAKDESVNNLFSLSTEIIEHDPISTNYYKGYWLKHPAQNNLANLTLTEKFKIISDFIKRPKVSISELKNYQEWLICQFGNYFANNFPEVYTRKYWTIDANELTIDWLGNRFSLPGLREVIKGALYEQKENFYYVTKMKYPTTGGYKKFLTYMAENSNIQTDKQAVSIDLKTKRIDFSDNTYTHYDKLVSSLPLPELVKIIKDAPKEIVAASEKLLCTSGQLVSLGFNNPDIAKYLWFYIYDEDILPARAYSSSLKSPNNVPLGKSSLQFETYYSKHKPKKLEGGSLIEHIVNRGIKMGLFSMQDIEISDYRELKYANVVFDQERNANVKKIHQYLTQNDISYVGRFGEWDYLWSDQSLLSGKKVATTILNQIK